MGHTTHDRPQDAHRTPTGSRPARHLREQHANQARRALLAATRGYGEDRGIFEHFPATVRWGWAWLTAAELAQVRYIEYSYWNEISGGSRLAADAAKNIRAGVRPYGVSNQRFIRATSIGAQRHIGTAPVTDRHRLRMRRTAVRA